jgi:hypothetical protein
MNASSESSTGALHHILDHVAKPRVAVRGRIKER